jgi:hypothetical protein
MSWCRATGEVGKGSERLTLLLITLLHRNAIILPLHLALLRPVIPLIPVILIVVISITILIIVPIAIAIAVPIRVRIPVPIRVAIPIRRILTPRKLVIATPLRRRIEAVERIPVHGKRPLRIPAVGDGRRGEAAER